jgi:isoquinoline 1-oxidoreductase alpha subunit
MRPAGNAEANQLFPSLQTQNLDLSGSNFRSMRFPFKGWGSSPSRGSTMNLIINGRAFDVDVEPDTPLLWAIRENIGLTGTKYGCGIAQCGACTVHVDGVAMRSCGVLVSEASGKQITTIEGLTADGALHKVQQAWIDNDVPQCGYCQTGMIMAVAALLKEKPKPTDKDIDESITNICRCGTFQQVREAIHAAANV